MMLTLPIGARVTVAAGLDDVGFEAGSMVLIGVVIATLFSLGWATVMWTRVMIAEARRSRWFKVEDRAFGALTQALVETDAIGALRKGLAELPTPSQDRTIVRLGIMIRGRELEQLARAAVVSGIVDRAIDRLSARRWGSRLDGVVVLSALGYRHHLAPDLVNDRSPAVRLAAVRWIQRSGDVLKRFDRLVAALEDTDGMVQAAAKDALVLSGQAIVPLLTQELHAPTGTSRGLRALLEVAVELYDPELVQACCKYRYDADPSVRARALGIYGHQSMPGSELVEFLSDPSALVRRAAMQSAAKRRELGLVGAIGRALDDRDWRVRDLAGIALHELGDVGMVVWRGRATRLANAS